MVIIIGGGICGLSIGWYLARAGCPVMLLERSEAGRGATWAAAGMLAPHVEAEPGEERLSRLLLSSRDAWADFARELEAASGVTVGYRTEGTLVVATDRDSVERLRFQHDLQQRWGLDVRWLSGLEVRRMEPHLARGVQAALYSPLDHQVDNRQVARALVAAYQQAGGLLCEHTEVSEILIDGDQVRGVRVGDRTLEAETIVLAAGAWSRGIGGLPEGVRPSVRPVKGQMLSVQMPPEAPLIQHIIWGRDVYLVPRLDGRLLIGATVEEQGFDTRITAGAMLHLLKRASEVLPGIDDLPILEIWAGLRPTSRDDAPLLGQTEICGLIMATGHSRNGILLAPVTARAISHLILTGQVMEMIQPFAPARFDDPTNAC